MLRVSAQDVRDTIIDRMVNNQYQIGSRLPAARELADELGAHRNTVSKAYNLLAGLGLVVSTPGRGTHVVAIAERNLQSGLSWKVRKDIAAAVVAARRLGMSEIQIREILDAEVAEAYRKPPRAGVFIECNQSDLVGGVNEIETITQIRLDGMLLDHVRNDPKAVVEKYSVAFTNLIHVKEVNELLGSDSNDLRIVGVYTQPDEDALVEIAKIKPGSLVGVVVDSPEGGRRFSNHITAFNPVQIDIVLEHEDARVRDALRDVETVVCSRSREAQLNHLNLGKTVIPLRLHISKQSALRVLDALMPDGTMP